MPAGRRIRSRISPPAFPTAPSAGTGDPAQAHRNLLPQGNFARKDRKLSAHGEFRMKAPPAAHRAGFYPTPATTRIDRRPCSKPDRKPRAPGRHPAMTAHATLSGQCRRSIGGRLSHISRRRTRATRPVSDWAVSPQLWENFLYRFKAAPRGRSRRRHGGAAGLPLTLPLRPAPTPVGWREKRTSVGAATARQSPGPRRI